jgi:hypothetical protein
MKIYDCFTFYNEFDLLELRLRELYNHVDRFVLVEADRTFQNKEKPLYFRDQFGDPRWDEFRDKILVGPITNMPEAADTWGRERHQRDSITRFVSSAEPDDIIMIGDIDEIPRVETVQKLRASTQSIWGFRMPLFNFKFNYMMCTQDYYTVWSGAIRRKLLNSAEDFRRMRHVLNQCPYNFSDSNVQIIEHAGWHFTYLGTSDFARTKIQSFAHSETNDPAILDQLDIEDSIRQGTGIIRTNNDYKFVPVMIDDYLPSAITNNQADFEHHLILNATDTHSCRHYLPPML